MNFSALSIRDSFKAAYPNDSFYVSKYKAPGGASSYHGEKLLDIQLKDDYWVRVYKLSESSGPILNDDIVKQIAYPFVHDTKGITNIDVRRDQLRDTLKSIFPDHNVNVFVYGSSWQNSHHNKGSAIFTNECRSDVCIVLN